MSSDESLNYGERWLVDSLRVLRPSTGIFQITVDMTAAMAQLEELRKRGVAASATHQLVRAAARAFAANPPLHQLVVGSRRLRPDRIEIGLSVTGDTFIAPVLILEDADKKSLADLAAETARRVPEVRQADREKLQALARWGRMPFGFLRRAVMRVLFANPAFRRKNVGTFQVSTVPVDWAATSVFIASGVLVGGQVKSTVVVRDGQPAVRPTMIVTLSGDHSIWDGRAAARFLAAVKSHLESPDS